ncbi:ATP phosphoribosyltransferase [Feifania hominis]|uniref:ATP phosphoribosyltransferase n=1 Tax=Feifania hominis TaxID=2763660 RepID=A0A926DE78_9FIRM|nr:ATP phosphoribosyltransferase [Feifania hominis]MBC8536201.1 ATP phosphoribosyltransferase [Feifania hominis]
MQLIRIALTKGRLEEQTARLLERAGMDLAALREKGRRLIIPLPGGCFELVLAKAADVLTYVERGVCDVGVVGRDTILEHGGSFYEVLDLRLGTCRFAVAGLPGTDLSAGHEKKVIASKYPNVAAAHFRQRGIDAEIIKIEGSVELAPLLHLAHAIVDIVESGRTLRENGLAVLEELMPVSARMIVNTTAMKLKKHEIGALIDSVARAVEEDI